MPEVASVARPKNQQERLAALEPLLPRFRERRREYDEQAAFPSENFAELRAAGLLCSSVPVEFGGEGFWWTNFTDYYDIYERIAAVDSSTAQLYQIQTHGAGMLAWHATPAQRDKYLPDVLRKGLLIASVGSEADVAAKGPEAGRAELRETADGWRVTCHKHFASLAPGADYMLIWVAVPGPGTWAERQLWVLVPRDAPGVELIDEWDTMGMRATVSWAVKLTDYEVPDDAIIGKPGAWASDPRTFTLGYVTNHLGTAEGAFQLVKDYLRERPYLAENPILRFSIGDISSELAVIRAALYACAAQWEDASAHDWDPDRVKQAEVLALQALHVSKRVALSVSSRAFEICGARASFKSFPFDMIYRDIRTFTLHHRDFDYMARVADAVLDGTDRAALGSYLSPGSGVA